MPSLHHSITRLVRQDLPLVKPCWLSQMTSLSSVCLIRASRRICSMIFPGTEVRLTGRWFLGSSFLPFLKMGTMFAFLQSPATSPDCQRNGCSVITLMQEFTCSHFFYLLFVSNVKWRKNRIKNLFCPSSALYMQENHCEKYKNSE